jgi:hypothetical protein
MTTFQLECELDDRTQEAFRLHDVGFTRLGHRHLWEGLVRADQALQEGVWWADSVCLRYCSVIDSFSAEIRTRYGIEHAPTPMHVYQ